MSQLMLNRELIDALCDFIYRFPGPTPAPEEAFAALAAQLFRWQYAQVEPYRRLCDQRRITPESWNGDWRSIPAVPTEAFKHHALFAGEPDRATVVFRTSGTTANELRGQHFFQQLSTYQQGAWSWCRTCVLPDEPTSLAPVFLAPSPADVPESSLGHMLDYFATQMQATYDPFCLRPAGVDVPALEALLMQCCEAGTPVFLATTSYALAWWLERSKWVTPLPPGSRVMETGGFKGFIARFSAGELSLVARHRLGIEAAHWLSEYGMTELSSQCYSAVLRAATVRDVAAEGLIAPPWLRVRVVDPASGNDLPVGEKGLIQFFDAANIDSVSAIYTQDLGRLTATGALVLEGRVKDAPERGCSLTALEMLGPIPQRYATY